MAAAVRDAGGDAAARADRGLNQLPYPGSESRLRSQQAQRPSLSAPGARERSLFKGGNIPDAGDLLSLVDSTATDARLESLSRLLTVSQGSNG